MSADLNSIARSYERLSHDIGGRINFGWDLGATNYEAGLAAVETAEHEQRHLDQAFFVLSFSALEKLVNALANARQVDDARHVGREHKFPKRLELALRVAREVLGTDAAWGGTAGEIESWYDIRSDIAHGESPTEFIDVKAVLDRAKEVVDTLDRVRAALA